MRRTKERRKTASNEQKRETERWEGKGRRTEHANKGKKMRGETKDVMLSHYEYTSVHAAVRMSNL